MKKRNGSLLARAFTVTGGTTAYFPDVPVDIVAVGIIIRALQATDGLAMITHEPFVKTTGDVIADKLPVSPVRYTQRRIIWCSKIASLSGKRSR